MNGLQRGMHALLEALVTAFPTMESAALTAVTGDSSHHCVVAHDGAFDAPSEEGDNQRREAVVALMTCAYSIVEKHMRLHGDDNPDINELKAVLLLEVINAAKLVELNRAGKVADEAIAKAQRS